MTPTFIERKELATQFAKDVARMQRRMQAAGYHFSDDDLVRAWAEDSDRLCAVWLSLPDDDAALVEILLKYLPFATPAAAWQTTVVDAGDGSGDAILEIPQAVLAEFGMQIGDALDVAVADQRGLLLVKRGELPK